LGHSVLPQTPWQDVICLLFYICVVIVLSKGCNSVSLFVVCKSQLVFI